MSQEEQLEVLWTTAINALIQALKMTCYLNSSCNGVKITFPKCAQEWMSLQGKGPL